MDILKIHELLNKIYPYGYSFRMREDGDIYVYVLHGTQWVLQDSWDTLAEFIASMTQEIELKVKRSK